MDELSGACEECYLGAKSSVLRSLALVPVALRRRRIDVFHGIDHIGIPLVGKTAKHVVTIHDVIPLIFPGAFTPRHRAVARLGLARVRRQADRVIVPSHAVKRDVVRHLGIPENLVTSRALRADDCGALNPRDPLSTQMTVLRPSITHGVDHSDIV